jgi:hypothetical protein
LIDQIIEVRDSPNAHFSESLLDLGGSTQLFNDPHFKTKSASPL